MLSNFCARSFANSCVVEEAPTGICIMDVSIFPGRLGGRSYIRFPRATARVAYAFIFPGRPRGSLIHSLSQGDREGRPYNERAVSPGVIVKATLSVALSLS